MLSGLWLGPLVLLLSRGSPDAEKSPLDSLSFGLTALFWIGHRLASTYVAFRTEAYPPLAARALHRRGRIVFRLEDRRKTHQLKSSKYSCSRSQLLKSESDDRTWSDSGS